MHAFIAQFSLSLSLSPPIWPVNEGPIQSYKELRPIIKSYFVWKLYIAFVGHSFNINIVYIFNVVFLLYFDKWCGAG